MSEYRNIGVLESREDQKPKLEIIDLGKYKCIIATEVEGGIEIKNEKDLIVHKLDTSGNDHQIYYPSKEKPKYFLKMRDKIYPDRYGDLLKKEYADQNPDTYRRERKAERVWSSVINELNLSNKIQDALKSEKVQKLVRDSGFSNITYIEPLGAFVNNENGHKFVIYPHVEMEYYATSRELVEAVEDALIGKDIYPSDLKRASFEFSGDNLFLLDTEGYYEIPK